MGLHRFDSATDLKHGFVNRSTSLILAIHFTSRTASAFVVSYGNSFDTKTVSVKWSFYFRGETFMRRMSIILAIFCSLVAATIVRATIFGTVRGVVHDTQHLPIPGVTVTLKAQDSNWAQIQKTNDSGEFEFSAVPIGNYTVAVTMEGFQQQEQTLAVRSDTSPVLHFELSLASVTTRTVVTGESISAVTDAVTPTTTLSRQDIQLTPGADRTNSLALITDYVPGAYMVHDMLHIRGGHQYSWLIDGVPVPKTNIASNVGPQVDPKDIDYVEVQRGSYDAEYGDRTYGIFNAVPRTGFERDRECDLVLSYGSYYQTNDQINCGGHSQRLAYYGSLNGNRSNLGLETPVSQIVHDAGNGFGGFGSLIFNADPKIGCGSSFPTSRLLPDSGWSVRRSQRVIQVDARQESDRYLNFSWVQTFRARRNLDHLALLSFQSPRTTTALRSISPTPSPLTGPRSTLALRRPLASAWLETPYRPASTDFGSATISSLASF